MFPLHDDNPTERFPFITLLLILACVGIFFWQVSLGKNGQAAIVALGATPAFLFGHQSYPIADLLPVWSTAFSSMFLHGGWMYLIGNMLYLWIFGNNIEDAMGKGRFVVFYLICGLVALLAHALPNSQSVVPMIGASGAISGILGAYLLIYPHARVLVAIPFGFIIHTTRIPAGWVLVFWFILQIVNSIMTAGQQGGVAWGAHIGGFVAGILLVPFFKRRGVRLFTPRRS